MKNLFIPLLSITFLLASCGSNPVPQGDTSKSEESSQTELTSISTISSSDQSTSEKKEYTSNPMKDPYISRQYYLNHIGDIYTSWKYYRGEGQTIAVIDEGFKGSHEDFTFEDGSSKVSPKSASFTYNNGKVTTKVGINYVDAGEASHGTFCAGVAAAGINGKGVVGIAPNAKLLLLKTDKKPKSIAEAFHYAADNGATVITISIGSYENYDGDLINDGSNLKTVFNEPVKYCYDKNIPVISAGGNGGSSQKTYPGSVANVIGVGGVAANSSSDPWADTTYNASKNDRHIDVMAPSDMMFGCSNYIENNKEVVYDGGWKGTSFASPQVAGMAALYFEKNPEATAKQFEEALYASCHKMDNNGKYGYGRVDVGKLLGINNTDSVTVRIKANYSNLYVYAWNLEKEKELKAWPGTKITKSNNEYLVTLKPSEYDSIVINDGGNNKSPDIYVSSFIYDKAYSLTSTTKENDYLVGKYV